MRRVDYGTAVIQYRLSRAASRTISITVRPDGSVNVVAPESAEVEEVDARVKQRARWILRQLRRFDEFRPITPPRRYVGGETHRYLGRQYRLKIEDAEVDRVLVRSGRLVVETRFPKDRDWIATLIHRWMRSRAHEILRERFDDAAPVMAGLGIKRPSLRVCPMKKRWGSHTPSGRVMLNDMLIAAPRECIDYVIVHELCHVVEPHHSQRFFKLLNRFMPDWERRKERLERSMV